jgi:hypothetical protein
MNQRFDRRNVYMDPVALSGGPLDGVVIEGKDWLLGNGKHVRDVNGKGHSYVRVAQDNDAATNDKADYVQHDQIAS